MKFPTILLMVALLPQFVFLSMGMAGEIPAAAPGPALDPHPAIDAKSASSDLESAAVFFSQYVYKLSESITIYNWSRQESLPAAWRDIPTAESPIGVQYAKKMSHIYWDSPWTPDPSSFYGPGLYAALDPVVTRSYGGNHWALLQMRLPVGFRTLILSRKADPSFPVSIQSLLQKMACKGDFVSLFNRSMNINPRCAAFLREIFQKRLHIDGFLYDYISSEFSECGRPVTDVSVPGIRTPPLTNADLRHAAFVITSDQWITPGEIRFFTSETADDPGDRLRIESLLYKHLHDTSSLPGLFPYPVAIHPPGGESVGGLEAAPSLLWPDLAGKETDPELGSWIRNNLLGCGQAVPFDSAADGLEKSPYFMSGKD